MEAKYNIPRLFCSEQGRTARAMEEFVTGSVYKKGDQTTFTGFRVLTKESALQFGFKSFRGKRFCPSYTNHMQHASLAVDFKHRKSWLGSSF
jgi:hypothetical protein